MKIARKVRNCPDFNVAFSNPSPVDVYTSERLFSSNSLDMLFAHEDENSARNSTIYTYLCYMLRKQKSGPLSYIRLVRSLDIIHFTALPESLPVKSITRYEQIVNFKQRKRSASKRQLRIVKLSILAFSLSFARLRYHIGIILHMKL